MRGTRGRRRRPAGGERARPGRGGRAVAVLRLRGQVHAVGHHDADPGADSGSGRRRDQAARVRGVRRHLLRGPGPGGLLLHDGREGPGQRDQHDAGDDPGIGVPDDVGGLGPAAATANRPDHPDGAAQAALIVLVALLVLSRRLSCSPVALAVLFRPLPCGRLPCLPLACRRGRPRGVETQGPPAAEQLLTSWFYFLSAGLSPLTRALKSAPARHLGTEDFGTWMVAPVAGLRAVRAGRSLFSKTPNPVIATLSPLATADWMASSTAFTASVADFLSPRRPESASIRSRLFMFTPALPPQVAWAQILRCRPRPLTCPKLGDRAPLHNNLGHIGLRVGDDHTAADLCGYGT